MANYTRLNPALAEELRAIVGPARFQYGKAVKEEYSHDEMPIYGRHMPEAVCLVESTEEVSAVLRLCSAHHIPVTVRGAGTGLVGGCVPLCGGLVLSMARMNRILSYDKKNLVVHVQPGVLLCDLAADALSHGLMYPPDPGEKTATIGGNVSTNAGGMKAVRYGLTRDFVRCVEAVLPDGSIMEFSSNVVKNTTGYDVKDLVIGSEGTLCILTSVTLKLLPRPNFSATLVMPFPSVEECADMVPKILALPYVPTAIEFLEQELLEIVERTMEKSLPVKDGEALLIVMYDAATRDELDQSVHMAAREALRSGALDCYVADTAERAAAVWAVRGSILEAMKLDSVSQEECDVVVPRSQIAAYVKQAKGIAQKHGLRVEPCGHCGDGNIHTELLRGPEQSDEEWHTATRAALTELYALAKSLGGQMSGEHGTGNGRLDYLKDFVGERMISLYKAIKLAFDDKLILNPGKVIEFNS